MRLNIYFTIKHKGNNNWEDAMQKELVALHANNTWIVVKFPKDKRPISCKWVYKHKYKADGITEIGLISCKRFYSKRRDKLS